MKKKNLNKMCKHTYNKSRLKLRGHRDEDYEPVFIFYFLILIYNVIDGSLERKRLFSSYN